MKPFILIVTMLASTIAGLAQTASGAGIESIENIVVIYAENRSFDNLYALFLALTVCQGSRRRSTHSAIAMDRCSRSCRRFGAG